MEFKVWKCFFSRSRRHAWHQVTATNQSWQVCWLSWPPSSPKCSSRDPLPNVLGSLSGLLDGSWACLGRRENPKARRFDKKRCDLCASHVKFNVMIDFAFKTNTKTPIVTHHVWSYEDFEWKNPSQNTNRNPWSFF